MSDLMSDPVLAMEIQRGLGRVEGKLDQIIVGMDNHENRDQIRFSDVAKQIEELSKRQSLTERKIWMWSGAIGIIAFLAGHFPFSLFK